MTRRLRWLWILVFAWVCFAAPAAEALGISGRESAAGAPAGAAPEDAEMAVRGLDATISIVNLAQGMNFRSKNNRMCFVAGTPVETLDGPRAIEQIREGDWVLSWDESKDELCWSRVEQTFATPGQPVFRLTLKLPDGSEESIECTAGHPFWVEGEGWVHAVDLETGTEVVTLDGPARVAAIVAAGRRATVYNFEVEETHCYFAGAKGLLAHNGDCQPPRRFSGRYSDGTKAYRTNVPRNSKGIPLADSAAGGAAHSRLQIDGQHNGINSPRRTYSATEFADGGSPVRRVDFAGRPGQPLPHQHPYDPTTKGFGDKEPMR